VRDDVVVRFTFDQSAAVEAVLDLVVERFGDLNSRTKELLAGAAESIREAAREMIVRLEAGGKKGAA
jgi:hypothetical protein